MAGSTDFDLIVGLQVSDADYNNIVAKIENLAKSLDNISSSVGSSLGSNTFSKFSYSIDTVKTNINEIATSINNLRKSANDPFTSLSTSAEKLATNMNLLESSIYYLESFKKNIQNLGISSLTSDYSALVNSLMALYKQVLNMTSFSFISETNEKELINLNSSIEKIKTGYASLQKTLSSQIINVGINTTASETSLKSLESAYNDLVVEVQSLKNLGLSASDSEISYHIDAIKSAISVYQDLEKATQAQIGINNTASLTLTNEIKVRNKYSNALSAGTSALSRYTAAKNSINESSRDAYATIESEVQTIQNANEAYNTHKISLEAYNNIVSESSSKIRESTAVIKANGDATKTLGDRLSGLASKFSAWLSVSNVIMQAVRAMKQMVSTSIEVDDAITQLKIVTDETSESYEEFADNIATVAQEISSSMTDLIDSATTYARLGYDLDESTVLSEMTAMLQNVGDIDVSDAQSAITSIIKAFDIDTSEIESVMDKLVAVGNNYPISVSEIAEGMTNVSSTLAAAGNSLDESIALLTAANTTIQDVSKASTGLRTIAARIRDTDAELDELGETMTSSEYDELVQALTDWNVALLDAEGEYRSTYDIISDIADVWDEMTSSEQAAMATALAGTRQQSVFYSLIEQFQEASSAMDTMSSSAGTLEESYNTYLESMTAHIDTFKAAFEGLSADLIASDFVIGIVDVGTGLLNMLDTVVDLINTLGGLKTVLISIAGIAIAKNISSIQLSLTKLFSKLDDISVAADSVINAVVKSVTAYIASADQAATASGALTAAATGTKTAISELGIAFNTTALAIIGITVAVVALVSAYSSYLKKQEEIREAALESVDTYNEEVSVLEDTKDTLDEISERYEELSSGVSVTGENVNLSTDEYEEYVDIVEQIAELFPELVTGYNSAGVAILSCAGDVDALTEAYKELAVATSDVLLEQSSEIMDDFVETANELSISNFNIYDVNTLSDLLGSSDVSTAVDEYSGSIYDLITALNELGYSQGVFESNSDFIKRVLIENKDDISEVIDIYTSEYEEQLADSVENMQSVADAYITKLLNTTYTDMASELQSALSTLPSNLSYSFFLEFNGDTDAMFEALEAMVGQIDELSEKDQAEIVTAFSIEATYNNDDCTLGEYVSSIDNAKTIIDTFESEEVRKTFYLLLNIDDDSLYDQYNEIADEIEATAGESGINWLNSLNSDDFELVYDIAINTDAEEAEWDLENWVNALEEAQDAAEDSESTYSDLYDSLSTIQTNSETVADALDEQAESGYLSIETYEELIALGDEYADCLEWDGEALTLNAEKVNELTEAMQDQIYEDAIAAKEEAQEQYLENAKAIAELTDNTEDLDEETQSIIDTYLEENATLQESITNYEALASSIKGAQDAYEAFENAQDTEMDTIETAIDAIQRIRDTFYDTDSDYYKRYGLESFQAALDIMVPDSVDRDDLAAIDDYIYSLTKYLTIDSDDYSVTSFDFDAFRDEAVEAGLLIYDSLTNSYELASGVFVEDFLTKMNEEYGGISEGLLQWFIEEWNSRETGDDFTILSNSAETALDLLQQLVALKQEMSEIDLSTEEGVSEYNKLEAEAEALIETLSALDGEYLAAVGLEIDEDTGDLLYWLSDTEYINLSAALDESSIQEVEEEIESTAEELGVEIEVSVDVDDDGIEETEEAIESLDGNSIDVDTDVDTTDISDANNELGLLGDRELSSTVTVEADTEEYEEIMSEIEETEYTATVTLTTDQTIYNEQLSEALLKASSTLFGTATIQTSTDESDITVDVSADTTAAEKEINKLNDIEIDVAVSADTSEAESALENLEEKLSIDVANVEVNLDTTEAEEDLLGFTQKVDTVDATVDVDAETTDAVANVSSLEIAISKIKPKTVKIKANVVGQSDLDTMKNTIDSIKSKTVTITTKTVTTTSSSSSLVSVANGTTTGMSYASGSAYRAGSATANKTSTALVGEVGPEILVDRRSGTWKTIGDAGAEFMTIHKGDIVFNADQTKALLSNGAIKSRGTSYASGTAYYSDYTSNRIYGTNSTSSSSSSSSSSTSSTLEDTLEELQETFEDLIDVYEHEIYMLEHEGGTYEEIIAVYQKMQDEVTAQLAEYRSLGADESSEYIMQLEENFYEYAEEIVSLTVEMYEAAVSELENSITLNENWLENAINAGDTESAKEYTEAIIEYYEEMQEVIHEEAEYYRSLGYSDTSDEVSALSDLWWDYADSIAEAMATLYSEIIEEHENYLSLMENWMTNSISYGNLDQAKEYTDEMIAEYQAIQDALHEEAEYYRSLGYSDTSDEVSELSDLWWDYEYEIIELMASYYEAVVEQNENAITLLQYSLDDAISDADYSSISEYTRAIQSYYQDMLDAIEEEVEYYLSLGYAETSNEVTELLTLWQSYADEMSSVISDAWDSVVDNASDALDDIQGYYDTLTNAAQEFAESGFITVDTFQEILSYGVEYLAYLQDENGYLVINEESIQAVIAARTEQLAVESALAYVEELKEAVIAGDTAQLLYLTQATEAAASSTWDLVYAQLEFLGLDDETYANALARINALRSLCDTAISSIGQATGQVTDALEEQLDLLEEQEDALDELLDYVMDMVEQMVENEIEALEDMIDAYQEIVDLQKESLELEQEKDEYTKTVAEKEEAIAELQQQIALLSLDDSREAAAEKAELEEELAELQEELADYISDYAYDAAEDTLDSMADAYEAEKNEEIETLEESISSTQKIYEMAIAYIDECWDTLYTDLMEWNYEYGTVTSDEIQAAWDSASTAVESYGSYLEAVLATTEAIADVTAQIEAIESGTTTTVSYSSTTTDEETGEMTSSYDTSGGEYTAAAQSIVAQMKANAAAWWKTDESGQTALAEENEELAEQLSSIIGREVVKDGNGVWHLDSTSGAVLFETEPFASYHTGGIVSVDDDVLKDDEVFAKLQEGEAVFTVAQIESLERILDMIDMIPRMTDAIDSLYANTIASNSIMDGLTQTSGNYENIVTDNSSSINVAPVITIEYTGSGTTEEEFASLSQTLSDTVITNINNAFAKKGKLPLAKGLKA